jgi:tripartite-type tricarboxylate transporter receptor subunit TctC
MGGHIPAASMTLTSAAGQLKAGAVRGIAITAPQRLSEFPDIPTHTELGFPELTASTWFALSGPAGLPQDLVARLNAEVIKTLRQPDIRQRLDREAIHAEPLSPAQFTAFVQAEIDRWTPIARASGAKSE